MKIATRFVGATAILFYALCLFVNKPVGWLWGWGASLPWLSLIVSIPLHIFIKGEDNTYTIWGSVYVVMTVVYVAAAYVITGSFLNQIPYLASCMGFIAYMAMEFQGKVDRKK